MIQPLQEHHHDNVILPAVSHLGDIPADLPVAIDYPRPSPCARWPLFRDELPKYLLAPEISALLH